MKKKTKKRVISIVISVVLSVALCYGLISLTVLSVTREYLISDEFNFTIENTDLATLNFVYNGEKITLEKYVKDYVTENIEKHIRDNPLSNYTNIFYPFADSITDFVVDKALSSDFVNSTVKNQVRSIFEYLLNSDVKEAKQRIKDGVTLDENYKLDPKNAPTFEERVSAEVKLAVFKHIEEESGMTTDEIIVLLSQETISKLKMICVLLFIVLFALSIPEFPSILAYISFIFFGYKAGLYFMVNDFKENFVGNEDLISHQLLKPLTDNFVSYADHAQSLAIICLLLFIVLFVVIHYMTKKKENKSTKKA